MLWMEIVLCHGDMASMCWQGLKGAQWRIISILEDTFPTQNKESIIEISMITGAFYLSPYKWDRKEKEMKATENTMLPELDARCS